MGGILSDFPQFATLLPTIRLVLKGANYFVALDPMSTHTYIHCNLASMLRPEIVSSTRMCVNTLNGQATKEYKNVLISLPLISKRVMAFINNSLPVIQGYSKINFNVLKGVCSLTTLNELRFNTPWKETQISALLGADCLPLVYKDYIRMYPHLCVGIGNTIYGSFAFGKFPVQQPPGNDNATALSTSCRDKNF